MGFFDALIRTFVKNDLKEKHKETFRNILREAIADGHISDHELGRIGIFLADSGLPHKDAVKIKEEFFVDVVNRLTADRRVSEQEGSVLLHLADQLELSPKLRKWMKEEVSYYALLHTVEFSPELPAIHPENLLLKKGETAHHQIAAQLWEERLVKSEAPGLRGMGLAYGLNLTRGRQKEKRPIAELLSHGKLVLTTKRLVFSGDKKSLSIDLRKILDHQVLPDSLRFSVTTRQRPYLIKFGSVHGAEVTGMVLARMLRSYLR